jgi:hypothetical protein
MESGYDQDPRADLTLDSARWQHLLSRLYEIDGAHAEGVYGRYHGMRCLGARLTYSASGWAIARGEMDALTFVKLRSQYIDGFQHLTSKILAGMK